MDLIQKIKILHNNLAVKNYKKVIEGSSKILRTNPNNAYVLNLTGMAYQGLMQHKIAIKCFHDALAKEPKNIAAMNNLANSYKAIGKLEFAEKLYKQLLVLNPNYLNALNNFANLKFLINKYSEGIEFLKKAILIIEKNPEKNPKQLTQILFTLASAYQSIGDTEETKKVITKYY